MNQHPLVELLCTATVRVETAAGRTEGSAFRIYDNVFVTAAHVVKKEPSGLALVGRDGSRCDHIRIERILPEERPAGFKSLWPLPDLAFIEVDDPVPDSWSTAVMADALPSGTLVAFGYVKGLTDPVTLDQTPLTLESPRTEADGVVLLKLAGGSIAPGMSGGPVLDLERGRVIGYVKADRGAERGGFVVSTATIKERAPDYWASASTHATRNNQWRLAAASVDVRAIDAETIITFIRGALQNATLSSPLLPDGLTRDELRQPVRLRPRSVGDAGGIYVSDRSGARDSHNRHESFIWDPLRAPWKYIGVVGRPGMGKSWTLAYHVAAIADRNLSVAKDEIALNGTTRLPVFVEAAAFARALPLDPTRSEMLDALARVVHVTIEGALPVPQCGDLLRLALDENALVLCMDGLDEVPTDLRPRLTTAISLLRPNVAQLLISSRESAAQALRSMFPREYNEFQLQGFTLGDARRFVNAWHRGDSSAVELVYDSLRNHPHLRSLATVPLLLGFICRLASPAEERVYRELPNTRSLLYWEIALSMLSGRWRDTNARRALSEHDPSDPLLRLRLLSRALVSFGAGWRERPEEFIRSDLQRALRQSDDYGTVEASAKARWHSWQAEISHQSTTVPEDFVMWEYIYDGFLVPGSASTRPTVSFLHMVFAELCFALRVAEEHNEERASELIETHRWMDDEWIDIIPIACGLADRPGRLLSLVQHPAGDPWLTQAELETRCIIEVANRSRIDGVQITSLLDHLAESVTRPPDSDAVRAVTSLCRLVRADVRRAQRVVETLVVERSDEMLPDVRFRLVESLAQVGSMIGCREAIAVVEDDSSPAEWVADAISALCYSNVREAVQYVATRLGASDSSDRVTVAASLAQGDVLATETARAIARDQSLQLEIRSDVVVALVESGANEEVALELLSSPHISLSIKARAMVALLRVGAEVSEPDAEALVTNPNLTNKERIELVRALLVRGDLSVLGTAADLVLLRDLDFKARRELARTMASVAEEGCATLVNVAVDRRRAGAERMQGLLALVERAHPVGVEEALRLSQSNDEPAWVRYVLSTEVLMAAPSSIARIDLERVLELVADDDDGSWEQLVAYMLSSPDAEHRLLARDLFESALAESASSPWTFNIGTLVAAVGNAGRFGVELLLRHALDRNLEVGARVRCALTAARSDPSHADDLELLLADESVTADVRSRMTVALGMLGCKVAFSRLIDLLPSSEPAYVALYALLSSPAATEDMMRRGRAAGVEARHVLATSPTPSWNIEYEKMAEELDVRASSDAERELRVEWAHGRLRRRVDRQLLGLLLPQEISELHRIGRLRESKATRNWLARWIPEYADIARSELERLEGEIAEDPSILPSLGEASSALALISQVASALDEWERASLSGDWSRTAALASEYASVLGNALARDLLARAQNMDGRWPVHAAHRFLSLVLSAEGPGRVGGILLQRVGVLLDLVRYHLDSGNGRATLDGAALAVMRAPEDASGWFYASVGATMIGDYDAALTLVAQSATHASVRQAHQGRESLLRYGVMHELPMDHVEEMRGVLAGATDERATSRSEGEDGPS